MDFDKEFKAELLRLREKLDTLAGKRVRNTRRRIYIDDPPPPPPPPNRDERPLWVRVVGNEVGAGVYYGSIVCPPFTAIDVTLAVTLTAPAYGFELLDEDIVIINKGPELGSGHSLTDTTDGAVTQTDFPADWWGVTDEETPRRVAVISASNPYECS